jgi:hypothetical protein
MLTYLSDTLSFVNLDYRFTNLPRYYIEPSILHKFLDQYARNYKIVYTNLCILHGFVPICTNLTSYCTNMSILQFIGLIHTHLTSYCTNLSILQLIGLIHAHLTSCCSKLSILQLVGLIRTHLTSCCMVGAIYSKKISKDDQAAFSVLLYITITKKQFRLFLSRSKQIESV